MNAECNSEPVDFWGLTDQDHIDAKVADVELDFRPLTPHLVERYYGTRENYIAAMEQQAVDDRTAVASAPSEAPASWRLGRLANAAVCETKARLERVASS